MGSMWMANKLAREGTDDDISSELASEDSPPYVTVTVLFTRKEYTAAILVVVGEGKEIILLEALFMVTWVRREIRNSMTGVSIVY